jgi:hypothetical protein
MRPYGFDETEQLRFARAHARALMEDWRMANGPRWDRRSAITTSWPLGRALRRVRRAVGAAMIALGRRLLPGEAGPRKVAVAAQRADWGC